MVNYRQKMLLAGLTAILSLCICTVNGQGTFIPSKNVPGVLTPAAAVGLEDDRNGFEKVLQKGNVTKWNQVIEGIPVYGSVLTTHNDEKGTIDSVQGFVSYTASLVDTTPVIDGLEALQILKANWKHNIDESLLDFRTDALQLQILQADNGWDKLVWYIEYFVERADLRSTEEVAGPVPSLIIGMVNAHTSEIEDTWNGLAHAKIKAVVGNTRIGKEVVVIDVEQSGKYCKHRDAERRIEVFDIYNQKKRDHPETTSEFYCDVADEDDWDFVVYTDAYSPRNEVFHHATKFVDMWKDLMGDTKDLYEDDKSFLQFYVHYSEESEDAFFDGRFFKFGDGKDTYYPLTSIDIVCHEIAHSVTKWHGARLEYRYEPGSIDEAYSDIAGETCDMYFNNKNDGLIGAEVVKKRDLTAVRSMCDPSSIGGSHDHFSQYHQYADVHHSSGVYNKAWCKLQRTADWDYIMAFEVFTQANLLYWKPTTTMHCGACGVESAAVDIGYNKADVTAAFSSVGVSCAKCDS